MDAKSLAKLAFAASAMCCGAAHAALPHGTLSFIEPTGTALATDDIEVWLRLTLDGDSAPLHLDSSAPNYGLDLDDLTNQDPTMKWISVTNAHTNILFGCSGNFVDGCGPGEYSFEWKGEPFAFQSDYDLATGASVDYHFVTFHPVGGQATPGTYWFYYSQALMSVYGQGYKQAVDGDGNPQWDGDGNPVYDETVVVDAENPWFEIANTNCGPYASDACPGFSREVLAVPEAETYAMMLAGLGLVGWMARHRRVTP